MQQSTNDFVSEIQQCHIEKIKALQKSVPSVSVALILRATGLGYKDCVTLHKQIIQGT